jgi:hypothetical protein
MPTCTGMTCSYCTFNSDCPPTYGAAPTLCETCDASQTCDSTCSGLTCGFICSGDSENANNLLQQQQPLIIETIQCNTQNICYTIAQDTCAGPTVCYGLTCSGALCDIDESEVNNINLQIQENAQEAQANQITINNPTCTGPICGDSTCNMQCPTFGPYTCSGPTVCIPSACETYLATCDGFTCTGSICDIEQENSANIPIQQMSSPIEKFQCLTYGPVCIFETLACNTLYPTSCSGCVTVGSTCGYTCGEICDNNIQISQLEIQNSIVDI